MIEWIFIRPTLRPQSWEHATENMNMSLRKDRQAFGYRAPVNINTVPKALLQYATEDMRNLKGQVLGQLETEEVKYTLTGILFDKSTHITLKAYSTPITNMDDVTCKGINLDEVYEHLQTYPWVSLGIVYSNHSPDHDKSPASNSMLYARDENEFLVNLSDSSQTPFQVPSVDSITYLIFKKSTNPNVVFVTVNPYLIDLRELNFYNGNHSFSSIDVFGDSIETFLLQPSIENARVINNSIILVDKDSDWFILNEYENSKFYHINNSRYFVFPRDIITDMQYDIIDENKIMFKPTGTHYLKIEYDLDSMTNDYARVEGSTTNYYEFIVIKG